MSIDTPQPNITPESDISASNGVQPNISVIPYSLQNQAATPPEHWGLLHSKILKRASKKSAKDKFGKSSLDGACYRWGVAVAAQAPCAVLFEVLSRLACQQPLGKRYQRFDLAAESEHFIGRLESADGISPRHAVEVIQWAAAIPELLRPSLKASKHSHSFAMPIQGEWSTVTWRLLTAILQAYKRSLKDCAVDSTERLMVGGELGLTLAWRFDAIPECKSVSKSAIESIRTWCEPSEDSVASAIEQPTESRLVLASLVRCQMLLDQAKGKKLTAEIQEVGESLARWVAAMTLPRGQSAWSAATRPDVKADTCEHGLLKKMTQFDSESLAPAIQAALGSHPSGGRLAWEVCLPSAMYHDSNAKVAVMMPEWDSRKSRVHLNYSGEDVHLEIYGGRKPVIAGHWQTMIEVDGSEQQPCGDWTEVCDYDDDDVHYIEIEQPWTGGLLLQRQFMQVREDQCVMVADAIVPSEASGNDDERTIRYASRLPMADSIMCQPEAETRELFLGDGRPRALVLPLSAAEWRVGPTGATLRETESDRHLLIQSEGIGRLYTPIWIDLFKRRFKRKRTWRRLTVAENLRICRPNEAVGFRVQVGSEQWMVYRSLHGHQCRSLLGKHLIADFYASRFEMGEGYHDALVTVFDHENQESME